MAEALQFKDNSILGDLPSKPVKIKPNGSMHTAPTSWAWHDDLPPRRLCLCGAEHGIKEPQ